MIIKPVTGNKYKWKGQDEVLVYLGFNFDGGWWHQFALIHEPNVVWCDVNTRDLELLELA